MHFKEIKEFNILLFDLDGVIYVENQLLPGAHHLLQTLRKQGSRIRFLTNDPRPTREMILRKLCSFGIQASIEEIITAGWATAQYLKSRFISSVYVVGSEGLKWEIESAGISVNQTTKVCESVVVGCDKRVTCHNLDQAVQFILKGTKFIAVNTDVSFPASQGISLATGALVKLIQTVTGVMPYVIGKPNATLFEMALSDEPFVKENVLMIGDTLETDILGAHRFGVTAVLLTNKPVPTIPSFHCYQPDAIVHHLDELLPSENFKIACWEAESDVWSDTIRPGVAAVILQHDASEVLLVKRTDNNLWGIPSGHIQCGESVSDAIVREIFEEIGLHIHVLKLVGVYSEPLRQIFQYASHAVHFITQCFECKIKGGCIHVDSAEIQEAKFFNVDNLPILLEAHKQWLSDTLTNDVRAYIR